MAARIGALQVNQTEIALKADVVAALPVGTSVMWTGDVADLPAGFMIEDGSAISRATYSVLWGIYSEGGTVPGKNGNGDGSTTFNLANKQALGVVGVGTQSLNGRTKTGPSDAYTKLEDALQGHGHSSRYNSNLTGLSSSMDCYSVGGSSSSTPNYIEGPADLSGFGSVRTAIETRESSIGVYFVVRVG